GVEEGLAHEAANDGVTRAERVAIIRKHVVAVDRNARRHVIRAEESNGQHRIVGAENRRGEAQLLLTQRGHREPRETSLRSTLPPPARKTTGYRCPIRSAWHAVRNARPRADRAPTRAARRARRACRSDRGRSRRGRRDESRPPRSLEWR